MDGSETNSRSSCDSLRLPSPCEEQGELMIKVKAQAMTIDESTGLWRFIKGNPLTVVSLKKDENKLYYIMGHRITDRQELFSCLLKPNTSYQRADATFHHWRCSDNQRHGLTFLHLGDARNFEKLVRKAIQEITPPRNSQSEEEIFVAKPDTFLLDCDKLPVVPSRPHKPRRLTEEYKTTSTDTSQQESSSSDRDSPTGASFQDKTSSKSLGGSKLSVSKPTLSSSHQKLAVVTDHSSPTNKSHCHTAVQPSCSEPVIPPRTSVTNSTRPVRGDKNCYTDYRNDCYNKPEQKKTNESAMAGAKLDIAAISLINDETADSQQLKAVMNTPPLPRKKKRHRQPILCCFRTRSFSEEYS